MARLDQCGKFETAMAAYCNLLIVLLSGSLNAIRYGGGEKKVVGLTSNLINRRR